MSNNYRNFILMVTSSVILSAIAIALYIWAYRTMQKDAGNEDVKLITLLCIVSLTAGMLILGEGYFFIHCEDYYSGFTPEYIDNIRNTVGLVSYNLNCLFFARNSTETFTSIY